MNRRDINLAIFIILSKLILASVLHKQTARQDNKHNHHTTTVLRPFFQDHLGEPVPEENFWTLWCKGRSTEADTLTIRLGATPSGLTSAHLHHPPIFFTGRMPFLPPNQQRQSTEGTVQCSNNCQHSKLQSISTSVYAVTSLCQYCTTK